MKTSPDLDVIVLAAGAGTRMQSDLPKVLHLLAGKPMIAHVLERAGLLTDRVHLVTGAGREEVEAAVLSRFADSGLALCFYLQESLLGTGHAVQQAIHACRPGGRSLILYGDVPLVSVHLLQQLVDSKSPLTLLTACVEDPTGYGRILREGKEVRAIVEQQNGTREQLSIREINTGVLCGNTDLLGDWLRQLQQDKQKQEYYLTDIVSIAVSQGVNVRTIRAGDPMLVQGVNTREQLAALETWATMPVPGTGSSLLPSRDADS